MFNEIMQRYFYLLGVVNTLKEYIEIDRLPNKEFMARMLENAVDFNIETNRTFEEEVDDEDMEF